MSSCFQLKKTISRNKNIYTIKQCIYTFVCAVLCTPMQSCTYTQNLFVIKLSMVIILICLWICCIHREM